jgi:hypothetical protein
MSLQEQLNNIEQAIIECDCTNIVVNLKHWINTDIPDGFVHYGESEEEDGDNYYKIINAEDGTTNKSINLFIPN